MLGKQNPPPSRNTGSAQKISEMGILEQLQAKQEQLEEELRELRKEVEDARKLKAEEKPVKWLSKADARLYFLNNGKPISHSTMGEWVSKWLLEGVLVINENCKDASGKILISEKFLMDRSKQKQ